MHLFPFIRQKCFWKAIVWVFSNAVFGLVPLLFLLLVNPVLDGNQPSSEINSLIHGGAVVFVVL